MTDEEFLRYCEAHCETPRAGFVPANIVRLLELADPHHVYLGEWKDRMAKDPSGIRSFGPEAILPLVNQARQRLRKSTEVQLVGITGHECVAAKSSGSPHVIMTVTPQVLVTLAAPLFKPENAGRYFGRVQESVRIAGRVGANGVIEITGAYEESDG